MIPVTKPFLPPINEYHSHIKSIYEANWLTNNGPLIRRLEKSISDYLDCSEGIIVANGTLALQLAIKALKLSGDVITTPFSYIATVNSLIWENCNPIFVDIDPDTWNINPEKIEAAITSKTTGILATHVFGNPSDIIEIQTIANKYDLRVLYDGAHAFGVKYKGKSIFDYGDITISSYHATKLYHMCEGGAIFSKDQKLIQKCKLLRNFGHDGHYKFNGLGINAKNSELHAAMGLSVLSLIDNILERRKKQYHLYTQMLSGLDLKFQAISVDKEEYNYSYMPILTNRKNTTLELMEELNAHNIYPRRYFYPNLNQIINKSEPIDSLPVCNSICSRILCLPIYDQLTQFDIEKICEIIISKSQGENNRNHKRI